MLANPAWDPYLPFPSDQLPGRLLVDLLHPEDVDAFREALEPDSGRRPTTRWTHGEGGLAWVRWSANQDPDSGHIHLVGHDVTALVESRDGNGDSDAEHEVSRLRLQLAGELHDGALQMLTGMSLQLASINRILGTDPDGARQRLTAVEGALSEEQRELRFLVEQLRSEAVFPHHTPISATQRLEGVLERVRGVWEIDFILETNGLNPPPHTARILARLVQEATVNAVRHGSASRVTVELAPDNGGLVLRVSDNGSGFSFKGTYDHDQLREQRLGPLSLKLRVEDAGWRLAIDSRPGGSTVTVLVPPGDRVAP